MSAPVLMCEMTTPHQVTPVPAVMVMLGGTTLCEECAVEQVRLAVRIGRDIHLSPTDVSGAEGWLADRNTFGPVTGGTS